MVGNLIYTLAENAEIAEILGRFAQNLSKIYSKIIRKSFLRDFHKDFP